MLVPKAALDLVDRGEDRPRDAVLGSARLVDRQHEGRDLELVDHEVRDAVDRGGAELRRRSGRVGRRSGLPSGLRIGAPRRRRAVAAAAAVAVPVPVLAVRPAGAVAAAAAPAAARCLRRRRRRRRRHPGRRAGPCRRRGWSDRRASSAWSLSSEASWWCRRRQAPGWTHRRRAGPCSPGLPDVDERRHRRRPRCSSTRAAPPAAWCPPEAGRDAVLALCRRRSGAALTPLPTVTAARTARAMMRSSLCLILAVPRRLRNARNAASLSVRTLGPRARTRYLFDSRSATLNLPAYRRNGNLTESERTPIVRCTLAADNETMSAANGAFVRERGGGRRARPPGPAVDAPARRRWGAGAEPAREPAVQPGARRPRSARARGRCRRSAPR